jgi:hypothetical protein
VRKLVEVKEGCRLSSRPDVLARLSVPTFLARYPALGGVCADASGLEPEFWTVYSLKTWRLGRRAAPREPACRVFVTAVAKRAALLQHARSIFAVRTRAEGQSLQEALKVAGVEAPVIALPLLQALPPELSGRDLVVAELPLAARHVAQAAEACAAQSCTLMLSLEDELVARGIAPAWAALARLAVRGGEELSPRWARWIARRAQLALEHSQRAARQDLKARERLLEDLLAVSGRPE